MTLRVPKLKGAVFESAVVERYRRREQSVEEAPVDMYLAGVSTRRVDDTGRLLWGERMPSQTLSDKPRRVYEDIDQWRNRPLAAHSYPYLFVDGVRRQAHVYFVNSACAVGGGDVLLDSGVLVL